VWRFQQAMVQFADGAGLPAEVIEFYHELSPESENNKSACYRDILAI
jgi:hypothetical protein